MKSRYGKRLTKDYTATSGDGIKDSERRSKQSYRRMVASIKQGATLFRRVERERVKAERQAERMRVLQEKENHRLYVESRIKVAEEQNQKLSEHVNKLQNILEYTLSVNDAVSFDSLKIKKDFPPFSPPEFLLKSYQIPDKAQFLVKPLNWFTRLIPGAEERYKQKVRVAEYKYHLAVKSYEKKEADRKAKLEILNNNYEDKKQAFLLELNKDNQKIDKFKELYFKGAPSTIIDYCKIVLNQSYYPYNYTKNILLYYNPESKQLKIEYELPPPDVIPSTKEYKYIKKEDTLKEIPRKASEINNLYKDVIFSVTLRTIHEIFEADQGSHIESVTFNGYAQFIDKSIGNDTRQCLISVVDTTKIKFSEINLINIDKAMCLKILEAQISAHLKNIKVIQ